MKASVWLGWVAAGLAACAPPLLPPAPGGARLGADAQTAADAVAPPKDTGTDAQDAVAPPKDAVTDAQDAVAPPKAAATDAQDAVAPPKDAATDAQDAVAPDVAPNPCAGVTCGGQGACAVVEAKAWCTCKPGFTAAAGPTCVANLPLCIVGCQTDADCCTSAKPADCKTSGWGGQVCGKNGRCQATGCQGAADCQKVFAYAANASKYVCETPPVGVAYCTVACKTDADCCASAGPNGCPSTGYGSQTCGKDGRCKVTGCSSTAECQAIYSFAANAAKFVCEAPSVQGGFAYCTVACEVDADCCSSADAKACKSSGYGGLVCGKGGRCQSTGCVSDAECQQTFSSAANAKKWLCTPVY